MNEATTTLTRAAQVVLSIPSQTKAAIELIDPGWTRNRMTLGIGPLRACFIGRLISSFTAMRERVKRSLLAGFSWRFPFSFGGFLEVIGAGRFFAA